MTTTAPPVEAAEPRRPNAFVRLYRGETSFDFVGRRRRWYLISALVILAGLSSMAIRGLNLGIDFRGGTAWEVVAPGATVAKVQKVVSAAGVSQPVVEILGGRTVEVQADLNKLAPAVKSRTEQAVSTALAAVAHVPADQVSINDVGPTWGGQVTQKAIIALVVFFFLIVAYISVRFEWKMAVAALVAVIHDLLVTAGVYSLTGLQVTPDTVVAILTILGYSLYDTVVVFDRVGENTKGLGASGRMTYEDVVNLSMNQVLARSVNTSLVAILPVLSVLLIGAELLGATTLQEFGLALVIGLTSGAYSSIFIASPLLAGMKEREPRYASIRQKLANRADREGLLTPRAAALLNASSSGGRSSGARSSVGRGRSPGAGRAGGQGGQVLRPSQRGAGQVHSGRQVRAPDGYGQSPGVEDGVGDGPMDPTDEGLGVPAATGGAQRRAGSTARPGGQRRPPPRKGKGKPRSKGGKRR